MDLCGTSFIQTNNEEPGATVCRAGQCPCACFTRSLGTDRKLRAPQPGRAWPFSLTTKAVLWLAPGEDSPSLYPFARHPSVALGSPALAYHAAPTQQNLINICQIQFKHQFLLLNFHKLTNNSHLTALLTFYLEFSNITSMTFLHDAIKKSREAVYTLFMAITKTIGLVTLY